MSAKDGFLAKLENIARIHWYYRPLLEIALKNQLMTEEGKAVSGRSNAYEGWVSSLSDKHFDMTTVVRLASEIELGLKNYYMERKNYTSLSALETDKEAKGSGIFQRIENDNSKTNSKNVVVLFRKELSIDLESLEKFNTIREIFVFRHLYAHRVGVIDENFLSKYNDVTGVDLRADSRILGAGYPNTDVVWFIDNDTVSRFITASQHFVKALP